MDKEKIPKNIPLFSSKLKIIFFLLMMILLVSASSMVLEDNIIEPNLTMSVPFPPIPVQSDGITNIAYELETNNFEDKGYHLIRAEAIDADSKAILVSLKGDNLSRLYHPSSYPPPTYEEKINGTKNLTNPRISFWIRINPENVPDRIIHHLTFNSTSDSSLLLTITGGEMAILKNITPITIGPPLRGTYWIPSETTGPDTHHFLSQITIDNHTAVPQRFAQDWLMMDANGSLFVGDRSKNENWVGYGKELIAVTNGTIASIQDDIIDNKPVGSIPPFQVSNLSGNYVILDMENGLYACYAHMIPGKIKVKTGDSVQKGDILGYLGNSGNSYSPHLHFQIVNGPDFLGYEGMPFTIDSFSTIESCTNGQDCDPITRTRLLSHVNELVESGTLVIFPD